MLLLFSSILLLFHTPIVMAVEEDVKEIVGIWKKRGEVERLVSLSMAGRAELQALHLLNPPLAGLFKYDAVFVYLYDGDVADLISNVHYSIANNSRRFVLREYNASDFQCFR